MYAEPGTTLVGRGDDVDFRIPDTGVSRHHAKIEWNGAVATLTDLNSTNGTAVNGIRISQWQLANGDEIIMGHSHFIIGNPLSPLRAPCGVAAPASPVAVTTGTLPACRPTQLLPHE
ncbi:MAG: FHA domain-containing protein [Lawsonella clevelandensis]